MSASRSTAAAQRRRAGPPQVDIQRGPATSINSSQMFSQQPSYATNQMRPGSAKISGQQAALAQQNMVQEALDQRHLNLKAAPETKISIPQAITLITLRLGKVETQLQQINEEGGVSQYKMGIGMDENENMSLVDKSVLESILARLESLEKRPLASSSQNSKNTDFVLVKQQMDIMKPALVTTKNLSVSTSKEVKELKEQFEYLKNELNETKQVLQQLETLSIDNNQKIMELLMGGNITHYDDTGSQSQPGEEEEEVDTNGWDAKVNELKDTHITDDNTVITASVNEDEMSSLQNENDISSVNLKDMIEEEFNYA